MPGSALFLGGTGTISSACVRRAVEAGFSVRALTRGTHRARPLPAGVEALRGDARDPATLAAAVGDGVDVVADFLAFAPDQVESAVAVLEGRVGHYVLVSSASAYQKPVARQPITESTPLANPFWDYARAKIACEEVAALAWRERGFPATIVRPSHTYDAAYVPLEGGWTVIERMREGRPVVVHGDGTSLWVLTHHDDFARAFTGLLANPGVVGDRFHVTGDELLTWDGIHRLLAAAAGVAEPHLVHVASETIARVAPEWGPSLLGDKAHSVVFDNTKIRRVVPGWQALVPFARGAAEIVAWHDADPARRASDPRVHEVMDALAQRAADPADRWDA